MVQTDNAGDGIYKTTKFSATYGYRLQVNRNFFIKFGAEAGVTQSRVDWNKLVFGDQIHPINGYTDTSGNPYLTDEVRPLNNSLNYLDISAGLLAYSNNFYVGLSAKHLNTPDETILGLDDNLNGGLPLRLNIHAGFELPLNIGNNRKSNAFISPNVMLIRQGDFGQINAGAYAGFGMFFGGLWYRHAWSNPDAAIALLGYQIGVLKIGYSYDFTIAKSNFTVAETGGTHEISLVFNFDNSESAKRRRKSSEYNDCFKLFR
jgi:type IX secretion system PorP/SprF family membrane protein